MGPALKVTAIVAACLLTSLAPPPASAAMLTGFTVGPNWAFGAPQRPLLAVCSDRDPIPCVGHFGLGPLSDVLDIGFVGVPVYTEASLNEAGPRRFVFGRLETGNERNADWWNLTIPNARWAFNAGFRWRDGDEPAGVRASDAIVFMNIGGAAHMLWASNNSDDPLADLPSDFADTVNNNGFSVSSFFDIFPDINFGNDAFTDPATGQNLLPTMQQCTDPACTQNLGDPLPTFVPEPGSPGLVLGALVALGLAGRSARHVPTRS